MVKTMTQEKKDQIRSLERRKIALEEELQTYELQGLTLDEKLRKIL